MDELDIYLEEDLGVEGDITSNALFTNEIAEGKIIAGTPRSFFIYL